MSVGVNVAIQQYAMRFDLTLRTQLHVRRKRYRSLSIRADESFTRFRLLIEGTVDVLTSVEVGQASAPGSEDRSGTTAGL